MKRFILMMFVMFSCVSCHVNETPGHGKKIGRIVKLSHEGVLCKTWEGELLRGGLTDGSGSMGASFHFTIENTRFIDIALECLESQEEVVIEYESEFVWSIARSSNGSQGFVKKIIRKVR